VQLVERRLFIEQYDVARPDGVPRSTGRPSRGDGGRAGKLSGSLFAGASIATMPMTAAMAEILHGRHEMNQLRAWLRRSHPTLGGMRIPTHHDDDVRWQHDPHVFHDDDHGVRLAEPTLPGTEPVTPRLRRERAVVGGSCVAESLAWPYVELRYV